MAIRFFKQVAIAIVLAAMTASCVTVRTTQSGTVGVDRQQSMLACIIDVPPTVTGSVTVGPAAPAAAPLPAAVNSVKTVMQRAVPLESGAVLIGEADFQRLLQAGSWQGTAEDTRRRAAVVAAALSHQASLGVFGRPRGGAKGGYRRPLHRFA